MLKKGLCSNLNKSGQLKIAFHLHDNMYIQGSSIPFERQQKFTSNDLLNIEAVFCG